MRLDESHDYKHLAGNFKGKFLENPPVFALYQDNKFIIMILKKIILEITMIGEFLKISRYTIFIIFQSMFCAYKVLLKYSVLFILHFVNILE